jgi:hypothetical protein
MKIRDGVAALAFGLLALPLAGCGEKVEGKKQAEATAERYYAAVAAGDAEPAVGLMDPAAFERTPREQLVEFLRAARQRLGEYRGHTPTSWRAGTFVTASGETFSRLVLTYRVRYSQHEADESLTFLTGGGPPRLVSVFIMSPAWAGEPPGAPQDPGLRRAAAAAAGAWVEALWGQGGR